MAETRAYAFEINRKIGFLILPNHTAELCVSAAKGTIQHAAMSAERGVQNGRIDLDKGFQSPSANTTAKQAADLIILPLPAKVDLG